jgi:hypothetical protein
MRPTWHFVLPENVRWLQALTAPNVKKFLAHYNRKLELTDTLFKKTNKLITKALYGHNYLTRQEIKTILPSAGIETDVQRLAHLVMWAELDGLICNGPRRGKQFTYALLDEWVPTSKKMSREAGLRQLAVTYFSSHGPAQLKDFAWWSGLSSKEATEALESIESRMDVETIDTKKYFFYPTSPIKQQISPTAFLLSIYDEYIIAYTDRSDLGSDAKATEKMPSMGNALTAVIVIDGKIVGTWRRVNKGKKIDLTLSPFRPLTKVQHNALKDEAEKYGAFFGMPVTLGTN